MFLFNTSPNYFALSSHLNRVYFVVSKCLFLTMWCNLFLVLLNAELCSSFQSSFFSPEFSSVMVVVVRKVPRVWGWIFSGGVRSVGTTEVGLGFLCFIVASIFVISGVFPLGVMVDPIHSILFLANSHFWSLTAKPQFSNFFIILSNSRSCSGTVPLVISNMPSRNRKFQDIPSKVLSILLECCWYIS